MKVPQPGVITNGIHRRDAQSVRSPKPEWLKVSLPSGQQYRAVKDIVTLGGLHTVCQEAMCPNIAECWTAGTATFMLLGSTCTRACRFCAVDTGNPHGRLDPAEPAHVAGAVEQMGLKYVVLTSVDRDDLPDGGAAQFARTVRAIKARTPQVRVESLTPDFAGRFESVDEILASGVDVYAQNLETVERLTRSVRDPRAGYRQTISVLEHAKRARPDVYTKTSLMVGLGETREELTRAMQDLKAAGVDILTFGQYLQPTKHHLPVERYMPPAEFDELRDEGLALGFLEVVSGPLVRSSYRAERAVQKLENK